MDEMSETESQGRESKIDNDGSTVPAVITDEYFDEITSKCSTVCFLQLRSHKKVNQSYF